MSKETLNDANIIVMEKEVRFLEALLRAHQQLTDANPVDKKKVEKVMCLIERETIRMNPKDKWDEEEVLISRIVKGGENERKR